MNNKERSHDVGDRGSDLQRDAYLVEWTEENVFDTRMGSHQCVRAYQALDGDTASDIAVSRGSDEQGNHKTCLERLYSLGRPVGQHKLHTACVYLFSLAGVKEVNNVATKERVAGSRRIRQYKDT